MDEQLVIDLSRHALETCMSTLNRTTALCNNRNETISIVASTCVNMLNALINDLRESGAPDSFINDLITDLRSAISAKPPVDGTTHYTEQR